MHFLVKNFLQTSLVIVLAVLASEVFIANCHYYSNHDQIPLWQVLLGYLTTTFKALFFCLETVKDGNWMELILVKKLLYLFHNKIYWLVLGLLLLICYYELKGRLIQQPIIIRSFQSQENYQAEKQKTTQEEVRKLEKKIQDQDLPRNEEKEDQEFNEFYKEVEETVFQD